MGIRESVNKNPAITTGVTIAIVVLAVGYIVWQVVGSSGAPPVQTTAYFSDDDGKTYFKDDVNKVPPFDHNGKPAVRANVFRCGSDGTPFVAYLERYTDAGKKALEKARANPNDLGAAESVQMGGIEVKKPGTPDWVKQNQGQKYYDTVAPKCPAGKEIEPVLP